ncbi:MAG: hypothetical protein M2R45_04907 [Verrucomicrobia subdivision 3 bacterium]|nr:hypothetical protein [Limisphaerales bacterium]
MDFNRDGRLDVAIAQNGFETKLFQNQGAGAPYRMKLVGGPGNRDAISATTEPSPRSRENYQNSNLSSPQENFVKISRFFP